MTINLTGWTPTNTATHFHAIHFLNYFPYVCYYYINAKFLDLAVDLAKTRISKMYKKWLTLANFNVIFMFTKFHGSY